MSVIKKINNFIRGEINGWNETDIKGNQEYTNKAYIEFSYKLALYYIERDWSVLDLGCGSGSGSYILAQKAKNVVGIDISEDTIEYAKQNYAKANITYKRSDLKGLPFEKNYFDASIYINNVWTHREIGDLLLALKEVTKNQGKIIMISVPKKKADEQTHFHIKGVSCDEFLSLLSRYFIVEKILGLRTKDIPIVNEIKTSDSSDYDKYIAICRNLKYTKEHYDLRYYSDMNEGVKSNPVAQIHLADLSRKIYGTKVLSIGCGTGIMEYWLKQKRPEIEIIGTDFTATDIQKELWGKYELDVTVSEAASQPFTDDSFDTVYTSHVLEHVINLKDVIIESIRISKIAAVHLVPINLNNPDHINFFKLGAIDNEYRTQEANIDLKVLVDEVIEVLKVRYPNMIYKLEISCPRDGSRDYGNINFHIRKPDRPDGLMPCFLISFFKIGH